MRKPRHAAKTKSPKDPVPRDNQDKPAPPDQARQDEDNRGKKRGISTEITIQSIIMVATVIYAIVSYHQFIAIKRQVEQTERALAISRKSLEMSQKPWINIDGGTVEFMADGARVIVQVANAGHSPATDLSLNAIAVGLDNNSRIGEPLVTDLRFNSRAETQFKDIAIGPGQTRDFEFTFTGSPDGIVAIKAGKATLSVLGNVVFKDEFSGKQPRVEQFCLYYRTGQKEMGGCYQQGGEGLRPH